MLLIPAALITGIVEDKIANDLTSNDKTTKKHLKEVEERILKRSRKNIPYDVEIFRKNDDEPLFFTEVTDVSPNANVCISDNNFLIMMSKDDGLIAITLNDITQYRIRESKNNTGLKLEL